MVGSMGKKIYDNASVLFFLRDIQLDIIRFVKKGLFSISIFSTFSTCSCFLVFFHCFIQILELFPISISSTFYICSRFLVFFHCFIQILLLSPFTYFSLSWNFYYFFPIPKIIYTFFFYKEPLWWGWGLFF